MSIGKKIFFYYCIFAVIFITISTASIGLKTGNILLLFLFLPVTLYFIKAAIKQRRNPDAHFAVKKRDIAVLMVLFFTLLGIGFSHISSTSSVKREFKPGVVIPTHSSSIQKPINEGANQTIITIETAKELSYVNVRQEATASSKIIDKAVNGQQFSSLLQKDSWYQVVLKDNKTGWISGEFVKGFKKK